MRFYESFSAIIAVQNIDKPLVGSHNRTILNFRRSNMFNFKNPAVMQADPFLFVFDGTLYVFYEEMHLNDVHGYISMISTSDLRSFTKPVKITHEPNCHFSYPFVFEDDGQVYMMPETGCDSNVRLYKAVNNDLTKFELYKVILESDENRKKTVTFDFADSCIFKKEGTYYLFTSYYKDNNYFLELYTSSKLEGPYSLHPQSPICTGNKYGRCGGGVFEWDGHLLRPAQDCVAQYGDQVHLLEIEELTPLSYSEHCYRDSILPKKQLKYRVGGHQLSVAYFNGEIAVATDTKRYCSFLLSRMINHLNNLFPICSQLFRKR